jgi:hypothetical protein
VLGKEKDLAEMDNSAMDVLWAGEINGRTT